MPENKKANGNFALGSNSAISVGLVIVILGSAIHLATRLSAIEFQLVAIRKEIDAATISRWTERDMRSWSDLLRARNPDLKVPEVRGG